MERKTESRYNLTGDPIFYLMVGFFALLATSLPALGGMVRAMPILQALCLTAFAGMAIRKRQPSHAVGIAAVWLVVQFAIILFLTWLTIERMERAVAGGFIARGEIVDWFYAGEIFPGSFASSPIQRLGEWVALTIGSLMTVGFVGFWLVVRAVNLAAFQAGTLLTTMDSRSLYPAALHAWSALRIAGSTGLVILFAEPLLTRNWSPTFYLAQRKRLIIVSFVLLILGLLLELLLPTLWRNWFMATG